MVTVINFPYLYFSLITLGIGELGLNYFKYQRRKKGLEESLILNWQEISFFQILVIVYLIFIVTIFYHTFR